MFSACSYRVGGYNYRTNTIPFKTWGLEINARLNILYRASIKLLGYISYLAVVSFSINPNPKNQTESHRNVSHCGGIKENPVFLN